MTNESSKGQNTSAEETLRQRSFIELAQALTAQKSNTLGRPLTYCLTTFGCQMNEKQSEAVAGIMDEIGYHRQDNEEADVVIYNTCTVRENANLKVYGRLGHLHSLKDHNPDMKIILFGCMMQEQHVVDKIKKSYPFVNLVFGTHNIFKYAELFYEMLQSEQQIVDIWEGTDQIVEDLPTERNYTFKSGVNIMFGCNNFCTYCIVPYVRGRERSRDPEQILNEVKQLVADGYKEIMLLGQNVNSYGKDLEQPLTFAQLLRKVNAIPGEFVVRFMSSHPKDATPELLDTILECPKIGHHLHLPVQSGSDDVLRRMNRRYTVEKYMESVNYLRQRDPDFSLTTDLIVGFPDESEADFQGTLDLIRSVQYDNIYTFIYSKRRGTKAAEMEDHTTDAEKKNRMERLLALQRDIASEHNKRFIGRTLRVLVDGESKRKGRLVGKDSAFIIVEFSGDPSLIGTFQNVRITEARNWAVLGELVEEEQA